MSSPDWLYGPNGELARRAAEEATAWEPGVIARYLTVAGSFDGRTTVDVNQTQEETRRQPTLSGVDKDVRYAVCTATCTGCGETKKTETIKSDWGRTEDSRTLQGAKDWAQAHASTCRAMPKPGSPA
jgi:hypothetical protein